MAHQKNTQSAITKLEDGDKFQNWKFRLQLIIEEKGLQDILECDTIKVEDKKRDAEARSLIVQCMGDKFLEVIKGCKNAKNMMDSLEKTLTRRTVMNKYHLKKRLIELKCDNNDKLQNFFLKFDKLVSDIEVMSKMEESDKVVHLLLALPSNYDNVTTALEAINEDLTLEKAKRNLLDAEVRLDDISASNHDNAFYIECWNCRERGHKAMYCYKNINSRQLYIEVIGSFL